MPPRSIPCRRVCRFLFLSQDNEKPVFSSQRAAGSTFCLNGLRTVAIQVAAENILGFCGEYQCGKLQKIAPSFAPCSLNQHLSQTKSKPSDLAQPLPQAGRSILLQERGLLVFPARGHPTGHLLAVSLELCRW